MAKKYEESGIGQLSEGVEKGAGFLSRILSSASDWVSDVSLRNVQVFAIRSSAGSTIAQDFSPTFTIQDIKDSGEVLIKGDYPVHANNGAGELDLNRDIVHELCLEDAQKLLEALESGTKLLECFKFQGWQKNGEPFESAYARGRELKDLEPCFAVEAETRESQGRDGLSGHFNNVGMAVIADLDSIRVLDNLRNFVETKRSEIIEMRVSAPVMPAPSLC